MEHGVRYACDYLFSFKGRYSKSSTLCIRASQANVLINEGNNSRDKHAWNYRACLKTELKLKAMYESNLVGKRSQHKVKRCQATFEDFLDKTISCHDLNDDDGSIHVDYNSPTDSQWWSIIKPIMIIASVKIKELLGIFGVKYNSISPFFRTF